MSVTTGIPAVLRTLQWQSVTPKEEYGSKQRSYDSKNLLKMCGTKCDGVM